MGTIDETEENIIKPMNNLIVNIIEDQQKIK